MILKKLNLSISTMEGKIVLKELILTVSTLDNVVDLNECYFYSFYFGGSWCLEMKELIFQQFLLWEELWWS